MRSLVLVLIASAGLLGASAAWAEQKEADSSEVASFRSPTVAPLARLGAAVAAVGVLGWGLSVWARRRHLTRGGEGAKIRLLASRSVGPRHQVALLEVGEHRLLIGMGNDSIATLADLTGDLQFSEEFERTLPRPTDEGRRALVDLIGPFEGLDG